MKILEEKIKKAANKFAEQEAGIGEIDRDALYKGFYHGAKCALSSQWVSVEDALPPDYDDVLVTLAKDGYSYLVVGWYSKREKRWRIFSNVFNLDVLDMCLVKFWMPIPPIHEARKEGVV